MPELRHDAVSGRLVIVAPERDERPHTSKPLGDSVASPLDCPFCGGNEHDTPPEVYRTGPGEPDTPGWDVRVVPNLYPIVGRADSTRAAITADSTAAATGAHEIAVLSPDHHRSFATLDDEQAADVVTVLRDRTRVHIAAGRRHVEVFVNHGKEAGASLAHPHAQIVALDFVPPAIGSSVARFEAAGADLVAAQITEVDGGPLLVADGSAPVWCPHGSGSPYEIRLAHRSSRSGIQDATDEELRAVAIALRDALARLAITVGEPPYNVIVHSAPPESSGVGFHWYIEVLPRLSTVAGFELGTGLSVNIVAPEAAAARLRDADPRARV